MGCRRFGGSQYSDKKCLILSDKPYQYQAAISDIAGNDIMVHKNDSFTLVEKVRNWLVDVADVISAPPPSRIWKRFNQFQTEYFQILSADGWSADDIAKQPFREQTSQMQNWIAGNPA